MGLHMVEMLYEIDALPRAKKEALKRMIDARVRGSGESAPESVAGTLFRIRSMHLDDQQQVVQYLVDEINRGY